MLTAFRSRQPDQSSKKAPRVTLVLKCKPLVVMFVLVGILLSFGDARDYLISSISDAFALEEQSQTPASANGVDVESAFGPQGSAMGLAAGVSSTKLTPPYDGIPAGVRLKIPSLMIDAPIVAVGLNASGEVEPPDAPDTVAWYNLSPIPGTPGNSILAGHIDWMKSTAVFWELHNIKPGDVVHVSSPGQAEVSYVVEWVELYPFDQAPLDKVFASLYEPALTIITCGGKFDQATHNYSHRLIVRALGH